MLGSLANTTSTAARTSSENVTVRVSAIIFQSFKVIMLEKCVLPILELNWNQRFRDKKTKLNICPHMLMHVVHTTAKQIISRRRKNKNVFKMSKDEKCTCKACKNIVFHCQICKFVGFLLLSSSWLPFWLPLPIMLTLPTCDNNLVGKTWSPSVKFKKL